MSDLSIRIFIAIIGLGVLGLIYYFGTRTQKSKADDESIDIPETASVRKEPSLGEKKITPPTVTPQTSEEKQNTSTTLGEHKIITLFVHARDGLQFDWHQIRDAAKRAGLEYGDDNLYYRYRRIGTEKERLFLVANMLKPGIFDPDMRTSGVAFIMSLPGPMDALDMWDTMFPVAQRMGELLDGKLTDDNHNTFSRQRIAAMREEMREFNID
ncbi:cell division protein ZipA [Marinicella sp. W31]|uniref:cell division protein ZipA n=1 Tax=Marinicella sp. W31 TaxID=3023713 RepID=UPI003757F5C6